jgi:hypothetical protein
MQTVADADRIVADLTAKHAAAITRRNALADERKTLSYQAHTGDKKARSRIDSISGEDFVLASEISSLVSAIDEAKRRQIEAKKAADAVIAAERQIELAGLDAERRDLGKAADAALEKLIAVIGQRHELQARMRRLGDMRGGELAAVNDKRCIETALMRLGRPYEMVEPGQRITFAEADSRSAPKQQAA